MGVGIWLGVFALAIEAVLYLAAFVPTKNLQKFGWDLMFYALIVNLVYGVVVAFTAYGGASSIIGSAIGTAIGLYFLFQIRASYNKKPAAAKKDS